MNIYEYSVKVFNKTITAVGFDIEDIAKCYPSAESIIRSGIHYFIGDGSDTAQSLTKATPVASAFTAVAGLSTGTSHTTIPETTDLTVAKPVSVAFNGPATATAWIWEMAGYTTLYDQIVTVRFETAGTYVMKLTAASDGGETDAQYLKITVT